MQGTEKPLEDPILDSADCDIEDEITCHSDFSEDRGRLDIGVWAKYTVHGVPVLIVALILASSTCPVTRLGHIVLDRTSGLLMFEGY